MINHHKSLTSFPKIGECVSLGMVGAGMLWLSLFSEINVYVDECFDIPLPFDVGMSTVSDPTF